MILSLGFLKKIQRATSSHKMVTAHLNLSFESRLNFQKYITVL